MKNKIIVVVSVAALVLSVLAFIKPGIPGRDGRDGQSYGANPGPLYTELQEFEGGVKNGYTLSTSTTATTQTITASELGSNGALYDTVLFTPNTADITITLPATSSLKAFLPNAGDTATQCWVNATTSVTSSIGDITFAAGTGWELEVLATSTITGAGGVFKLQPLDTACFRFTRMPSTATTFDINALLMLPIDAD